MYGPGRVDFSRQMFYPETGGGVKTEKLSAKLVELAALLADRDTKMSALTEFVKNRFVIDACDA